MLIRTYHVIVNPEKDGVVGQVAEKPVAIALSVIQSLVNVAKGELKRVALETIAPKLSCYVHSGLLYIFTGRRVGFVDGFKRTEISVRISERDVHWYFHYHCMIVTGEKNGGSHNEILLLVNPT